MNKDIMRALGAGDWVDCVEHFTCPGCREPISETTFRDDISRKEFLISGMCQHCQDSFFDSGE